MFCTPAAAMPIRFSAICTVALLICLSLAFTWAVRPQLLLAMWAIDGNPPALFVGRRAAALFFGLAFVLWAVRRAPPSPVRTAVADGVALACAALAALGLAEFAAGHAGAGILLAVAVEAVLAIALFRLVRAEAEPWPGEPWMADAPAGSDVAALTQGATFQDAWAVAAADPGLDAMDQCLLAMQRTPRWADMAMALRNRIVVPLGLKDLGRLSAVDAARGATDRRPGARAGIFTVRACRPDEVLLEDRDAHLDVVVSVHRGVRPADGVVIVTVTTVVRTINRLGRLYLGVVRPAHPVVVRAMLRRIGGQAARTTGTSRR